MLKPTLIAVVVMCASVARAQDIVGLEDCAQAKSADKKIGCLQSNVGFLHALVRKNDVTAQSKFRDDAARLAALTAQVDQMRDELKQLRSKLDDVEKRIPSK